MYKIVIEHRAAKEIESLPSEVIKRVVETLRNLQVNPRPFGVKKLFNNVGWRIRVGNYRILYTIDDRLKLVSVYRVKHRRDVYR